LTEKSSTRFPQSVCAASGDLRKQDVHRRLAFESDKGLSDYLLDDCPVSDLIIWPGIDKLTVISGGRHIHESTELLGSTRMAELVHEMKTRYPDRYVFFDTPPILDSADALAFVPLVDHIIIVVKAHVTQEDDVKTSLELIPQEKVAGFVLNQYRAPVKKYPAATKERKQ
jgi:protein-tyrosine kinase